MKIRNMSDAQKESWARWLPALIAVVTLVGNVLYVGYVAGVYKQKIEAVETRMVSDALATKEQLHDIKADYVPRNEYSAAQIYLTQQLGDVKFTLKSLDTKLDRIVERQYSTLTTAAKNAEGVN